MSTSTEDKSGPHVRPAAPSAGLFRPACGIWTDTTYEQGAAKALLPCSYLMMHPQLLLPRIRGARRILDLYTHTVPRTSTSILDPVSTCTSTVRVLPTYTLLLYSALRIPTPLPSPGRSRLYETE